MYYPQDCADVNQPVQGLPAFASQPTDPARRGCGCQWNQQHKSRKSYSDVFPLSNVFQDFMQVEKFIEPKIGREMQAPVKERKQSQHATELDQCGHAQQFSQRGNSQGDQKKTQSPIPEAVLKRFNGVRSQPPSPGIH